MCPSIIFLILLLLECELSVGSRVHHLLFHDYCAVRPYQTCCPGRNDGCTMSIADTVCYCDEFCNRTVSDCCPDFWPVCMGVEPPYGAMTVPPPTKPSIVNNCRHQGALFSLGSEVRRACNNCTCVLSPSQLELSWKCSQLVCLVRQALISRVNGGTFGWRASNYSFLWGLSRDEGFRFRLGTEKPVGPVQRMTSLHVHVGGVLPSEFDSRRAWPRKIHAIRDQGDCGASWAFSTTALAADRLALHSNGTIRSQLSPQQLLDCNRDSQQKGCDGGHVDRAWWYIRRVGLVSSECYPYTSGASNQVSRCKFNTFPPAGIRTECPEVAPSGPITSAVFQATPPYRIGRNEREIMRELQVNGPVQATMKVYEDFFVYKSGVYQHSAAGAKQSSKSPESAYHSVLIHGWGTDDLNGQKYWLVANSWGTSWGEDGYFRIVRGINECEIESFVVAVWGKMVGRDVMVRDGLAGARRRSARQVHFGGRLATAGAFAGELRRRRDVGMRAASQRHTSKHVKAR